MSNREQVDTMKLLTSVLLSKKIFLISHSNKKRKTKKCTKKQEPNNKLFRLAQ